MMQKLINKITGRKFWYQIKINVTKNTEVIGWSMHEIGIEEKSHILNTRQIKKQLLREELQWCLTNDKKFSGAIVSVEVLSYLGYFRKN